MTQHRLRPALALPLAAMLLGGCATPAASPSPQVTATPSESPVARVLPGTAALAQLSDPDAAIRATITGTLEIDRSATVKGLYLQRGRDFHISLTTTVADVTFTVEQKVVDDQSFLLNPDRPWHHDPVASGSHRAPTLAEALTSVEARGPDGTLAIAGETLERYALDGLAIGDLTSALGLSDPGVVPTATSSAFFASADGAPGALDLQYTVPRSEGTPATSTLRFTFEPDRLPTSIDAPADPWVTKPEGHGYAMWYPQAWQAELDRSDGDFTDVFVGPDASVTVYCVPDAKLGLKDWAADGRTFYAKYFDAQPDSTDVVMLGDVHVEATSWETGTIEGVERAIINVAMVKGPVGCDIQWMRAPGPSGTQDDTFRTFLGTFYLD
jgi:hypothetical protein